MAHYTRNITFEVLPAVFVILQCGFLVNTASLQTNGLMDNCTDCCDLLQCMGLSDRYFDGLSSPDQYLTDMCKEKNIAIIPTCYSKHNLNHCTYTRKLVDKIPAQGTLAKSLIEYCKHQNMTKALTHCLIENDIAMDMYNRCTKPYTDGMTDNDSSVCQVMDNYMTCSLALLKTTNCSDVLSVDFKASVEQQKLNNPLCQSNIATHLLTNMYVIVCALIIVWTK